MQETTIKKLNKRSARLLRRLITSRGIFASTDNGWEGPFHAWFGRDSAITALLVFRAEGLTGRKRLSKKAYKGLLMLRKWQGGKNSATSGEEKGKITHEVRKTLGSRNRQTLARIAKYHDLWFLDRGENLLKSWDSVDSTPLWIIGVIRWHMIGADSDIRRDVLDDLRSGLEWCLANLKQYDGLAGFIGADLDPARTVKGLHNQGWKDNDGAYQYADGQLAKHPIKDVFVNAIFWAALKYGAEVFVNDDPSFAARLENAAEILKAQFNDPRKGFLVKDKTTSSYYFAEALDGYGKQLSAITADVGMCLWADYGGECIIDAAYIDDVVDRLMRPDMLDPDAGMRNYSRATEVKRLYAGGYHRGPDTYWPFVSGLIVQGFDTFGYKRQARAVARAALRGAGHFDSCIELFVKAGPGDYQPWHHVAEDQQSATDQAWSAASIYYMCNYLSKDVS